MIARILNAQGILSSDVPTGNLLWVDAVNGIDALAARGRLTVPFKTLGKAKELAVSGDTIVVLPGVYDERNLLKNGVNWHFMLGVIVHYTGSANGAIFDDASGAVECLIGGLGQFTNVGTGTDNYVIKIAQSGSDIRFLGLSLNTVDALYCAAGSLFVELKGNLTGTIASGGGQMVVRSDRLIDTYLSIDAGTHHVSAREALELQLELNDGELYYHVPKTTGRPGEYAIWATGGVLRLIDSVVLAAEDVCAPGYAVAVSSGAKIILKDSHAIDQEHSYAVGGNGSIVCLGAVWSNKALDPGVTNLTNLSQSYFYDVDAEF